MKVHIGEKIKEVVKESGMTVTEFAKRMGYSRRNVYVIFEKETLDVGLMERIGKVLDHDFMQYYFNEKKYSSPEKQQVLKEYDEKVEYYKKQHQKNKEKIDTLQNEVQYLKEINRLLKDKLEKESSP